MSMLYRRRWEVPGLQDGMPCYMDLLGKLYPLKQGIPVRSLLPILQPEEKFQKSIVGLDCCSLYELKYVVISTCRYEAKNVTHQEDTVVLFIVTSTKLVCSSISLLSSINCLM